MDNATQRRNAPLRLITKVCVQNPFYGRLTYCARYNITKLLLQTVDGVSACILSLTTHAVTPDRCQVMRVLHDADMVMQLFPLLSCSLVHAGSTVTFDFRRLCRPQQDYVLEDKQYGHMYYAQICGKAAKSCLPQDWENQYQFGNAIQTWGTPPACLNVSEATCVDSRTGLPTCCSEPCQVVAVETTANPPIFAPVVAGDPSQGVRVTYMGGAWQPASCFPSLRLQMVLCAAVHDSGVCWS